MEVYSIEPLCYIGLTVFKCRHQRKIPDRFQQILDRYMEIDFVKLMTTKSNEGFQEYIDNRQKYTPAAIYVAIDEFKKRGKVFTDKEFTQIVNDIEKQQELSRQRAAESEGEPHNKNVVDAPDFPTILF